MSWDYTYLQGWHVLETGGKIHIFPISAGKNMSPGHNWKLSLIPVVFNLVWMWCQNGCVVTTFCQFLTLVDIQKGSWTGCGHCPVQNRIQNFQVMFTPYVWGLCLPYMSGLWRSCLPHMLHWSWQSFLPLPGPCSCLDACKIHVSTHLLCVWNTSSK